LAEAEKELNDLGVAPLIPNLLTLKQRLEESADAAEAAKEATEAQAEAHLDAAEAIDDQIDAQMALTDDTWAARIAAQEWAETLEDGTGALGELKEGTADYLKELDSQRQTAEKAAQTQVNLAEGYAEAEGGALGAADALDIWNGNMLDSARAAEGPLKASLIEAIALKNNLTEDEVMEILVIPDVAAAEAALTDVSRTRDAEVDAVAKTAAAAEQLRQLTLPREVLVATRFVDPGANPFIGPGGGVQNIPTSSGGGGSSGDGTSSAPDFFFHDGGHVTRQGNGSSRAGLRNDEVSAVLQTGEYVMSRDDVAAASQGGAAGGVTVQLVGDIYGVPSEEFVAELADKLNKYAAGMA
jgi:hypothetical protein